jgi:hypothetical protein
MTAVVNMPVDKPTYLRVRQTTAGTMVEAVEISAGSAAPSTVLWELPIMAALEWAAEQTWDSAETISRPVVLLALKGGCSGSA